MFYLCDLLFISFKFFFIFRTLIFEAKDCRPSGPFAGCWNVV